jgi:hypothetical protein
MISLHNYSVVEVMNKLTRPRLRLLMVARAWVMGSQRIVGAGHVEPGDGHPCIEQFRTPPLESRV